MGTHDDDRDEPYRDPTAPPPLEDTWSSSATMPIGTPTEALSTTGPDDDPGTTGRIEYEQPTYSRPSYAMPSYDLPLTAPVPTPPPPATPPAGTAWTPGGSTPWAPTPWSPPGTPAPPAASTSAATPPPATPYSAPPPWSGPVPPSSPTVPSTGGPVAGPAPVLPGGPAGPGSAGSVPRPGYPYSVPPPRLPGTGTNTSAVVLAVISGLMLVSCLGITQLPALVLAVLGITRQSTDPVAAARSTRRGWIAFVAGIAVYAIGFVLWIVGTLAFSNSGGVSITDGGI